MFHICPKKPGLFICSEVLRRRAAAASSAGLRFCCIKPAKRWPADDCGERAC